jgi:hypothetical protein
MRKIITIAMFVAMLAILAVPTAAMAAPTSGPEAGPGCFGQWRAGSVQLVNETNGGVYGMNVKNAGKIFSDRAGDNAEINAANRATCDAL